MPKQNKTKKRSYVSAAKAVIKLMRDNGIDRVEDTSNFAEDSNGNEATIGFVGQSKNKKVCRVCLLGGLGLAVANGVITITESLTITSFLENELKSRNDHNSRLDTVPDRGTMFDLYLTASKKADEEYP